MDGEHVFDTRNPKPARLETGTQWGQAIAGRLAGTRMPRRYALVGGSAAFENSDLMDRYYFLVGRSP